MPSLANDVSHGLPVLVEDVSHALLDDVCVVNGWKDSTEGMVPDTAHTAAQGKALHTLFKVLIEKAIEHRVGDCSGHGEEVTHCEDGEHQLLVRGGDWLLVQEG